VGKDASMDEKMVVTRAFALHLAIPGRPYTLRFSPWNNQVKIVTY
jgi:hypothetical protein